jgi:hypothetical protein
MVNKATEKDVAKIKRLVESALSPREKAMYKSLLHKAEQLKRNNKTKRRSPYTQIGFNCC